MSEGPNLRALLIQHEDDTPPGVIGEWLAAHSAEVDELHIYVEDREVDPRAYDLLISLGSEFAAYDTSLPWLEREEQIMREAVAADVAIFGVCFGGQLLARVLGGDAMRADDWEIGWLPVSSNDPDLISEGPWFQWHFDRFVPPPGATLLAESPAAPQAFLLGRSLGLQFHPEVTNSIMEQWIEAFRHELDETGVDPEELMAGTRTIAGEARERGLNLLDAFTERVSLGVVRS